MQIWDELTLASSCQSLRLAGDLRTPWRGEEAVLVWNDSGQILPLHASLVVGVHAETLVVQVVLLEHRNLYCFHSAK